MADRAWSAHASRLLTVSLGTSLILIACGSDGGAPSDTVDPSTTPHSQTAEAPASEGVPPETVPSDEPSQDASDSPLGATITVGAETWTFELSEVFPGGCWVDANGIDTGGSVDGDTMGVTFAATDLRQDGGHLYVTNHPTMEDWMARADRKNTTTLHLLPDGVSQIDSITIDGGRISGTATFIETNAVRQAVDDNTPFPASVAGSFDIQCPG